MNIQRFKVNRFHLLLFLTAFASCSSYERTRVPSGSQDWKKTAEYKGTATPELWDHAGGYLGSQMKNAPCMKWDAFTEMEMISWLEEKVQNGTAPVSQTVAGIQFKNESTINLDLFQKLMGDQSRSVSSSCDKVPCAVQEIFGKKVGTQLLFMLGKFGFNGSHLVYQDSQPWKSRHLDIVLLALSDFPSRVFPLYINRPLYLNKNKGQNNEGANATITVRPGKDLDKPLILRENLVHEIAHVLDEKSGIPGSYWTFNSLEWQKVGNWKVISKDAWGRPNGWESLSDQSSISKYGQVTALEDFAESVVSYRYNGVFFAHRSPEKYKMIRKLVFGGVEYLSGATCDGQN